MNRVARHPRSRSSAVGVLFWFFPLFHVVSRGACAAEKRAGGVRRRRLREGVLDGEADAGVRRGSRCGDGARGASRRSQAGPHAIRPHRSAWAGRRCFSCAAAARSSSVDDKADWRVARGGRQAGRRRAANRPPVRQHGPRRHRPAHAATTFPTRSSSTRSRRSSIARSKRNVLPRLETAGQSRRRRSSSSAVPKSRTCRATSRRSKSCRST